MKRWLAGLLVLVAAPSFAQGPAPLIPFESVPNPLTLPEDMYLGEVAGVAVNSQGHIFVFSRGNTNGPAYAAAAAQLLEFDPGGKYLREIGKNLYAWSFAHSVRIDQEDNIWIADKGSDLVIKFSPQGRVLMVFGRKQEASDEETGPVKHPKPPLPAEDGRFRQVTDMAWDPAGNTYISDGYINSRVAKADKNGNWLMSWGDRGKRPGEFDTPHNIAADAQGNIYVADRGNRRIQVFDGQGKLLRQITIDVPYDRNARPAIGNRIDVDKLEASGGPLTMAPGSRGRCASRRGPARCSTPPMRSPAACTSSAWMGRCCACSANRASSSSSSAGSTPSPAHRKMSSMSGSC